MMDLNTRRWFQAQQVIGSRGETTTVIHEIWPSVSRRHAKAAKASKPSKKARRKRSTPRSSPSLLRLPVELRKIIFTQDLLEWTDNSITPSLIVACERTRNCTTKRWKFSILSKLVLFHHEILKK